MSTGNCPKHIANPYISGPNPVLLPRPFLTPRLAIEAHAEYRSLAVGYGPTQPLQQMDFRSNENLQNTTENKLHCKQCGACCLKGGPALHTEDLPLIEDGTIQLADMVTLRPGERVFDQPAQSILPLEHEIIKIKGRDNSWTCKFYSPDGQNCGIYKNRPLECEVLFCQDTEPLAAIYNKNRLTRADLLPQSHPLMELVTEHDKRCAPQDMEEIAKKAREGDAQAGAALKEMVAYDMEMRRLLEKKGGPAAMNDFLLGRPLRVLLGTMNIKVYEMGDSIRFNFALGE